MPVTTLAPMEPVKLRDIPPFSLRLHPELRTTLQREADIHGVTLHAEILQRLRVSLGGVGEAYQAPQRAEGAASGLAIGDAQRMLLGLFDAMPPDKQLALLTVLRR